MRILVTGAAGFIGFSLARKLLEQNHEIIGIDNLNDYYDPNLKLARIAILQKHEKFIFEKIDIADKQAMADLFAKHKFDIVVHLAAQAGVRYSLENPHVYIETNVIGHLNILEGVRHNNIPHLVYASSSSVYGGNKKKPFAVEDRVDNPVSLYAATKKSDELMSYCYSHLYGFSAIGLRFFSVYGPWGRPDMAAFLFADAIINDKPINVFNHGNMKRDFTYIDDIVAGIIASINYRPTPDDIGVRHRVYNIGNNRSENLMDYIGEIEKAFGVEAKKNFLPLQAGDVPESYAEISASQRDLGFRPTTPISVGIPKFISWYKEYYGV